MTGTIGQKRLTSNAILKNHQMDDSSYHKGLFSVFLYLFKSSFEIGYIETIAKSSARGVINKRLFTCFEWERLYTLTMENNSCQSPCITFCENMEYNMLTLLTIHHKPILQKDLAALYCK